MITREQLEQLETMRVQPEYRKAFSAALSIARAQATRGTPIEISLLRERHRQELDAMAQRHAARERELLRQITDLNELVHPAKTWFAGKNPHRAKVKGLYCSWLQRWRQHTTHVRRLVREQGPSGLHRRQDHAIEVRVEQAARALFDAAAVLATEVHRNASHDDAEVAIDQTDTPGALDVVQSDDREISW